MKSISAVLVLVFGLLLVLPAFAAEEEPPASLGKEEILLKDGTNGIAEVLATTKHSVKVKFVNKAGIAVEMGLDAGNLDPHCFYEIRRAYMEDTAANHLDLAIFCAENGMYNRGKMQYEMAVKLDAAYVQKQKEIPGIRDGIAAKLFANAKHAYEAGRVSEAKEMYELLTTRFSDTPSAAPAREYAAKARAAMDKKEAGDKAKTMARHEKLEQDRINVVLAPIEKQRTAGRNLDKAAGEQKNNMQAKQAYKAAGDQYRKTLARIAQAMKQNAKDENIMELLTGLQTSVKAEAVSSYLNAGNIELSIQSIPNAQKFGKEALEVDPESQSAKSFLASCEAANSDGYIDPRYRRGARTGARRGGGGGRR